MVLKIPDPEFSGENMNEVPDKIIQIDHYDVAQWVPGRDGKGKPQQVHLTLWFTGLEGFRFVMRFKSPRELDRMITILSQYRSMTWGGAKQ